MSIVKSLAYGIKEIFCGVAEKKESKCVVSDAEARKLIQQVIEVIDDQDGISREDLDTSCAGLTDTLGENAATTLRTKLYYNAEDGRYYFPSDISRWEIEKEIMKEI